MMSVNRNFSLYYDDHYIIRLAPPTLDCYYSPMRQILSDHRNHPFVSI